MMHAITGTVQHGKGLGKSLGFPTVNIFCNTPYLQGGTRRVNVFIDDTIYRGVGPYFPERELFEIHILDFEQDIYDKEITLFPLKKIRENQKFERLDELTKQIAADKEYIATHDITIMTFGTFDHFHPGHEAYLSQAAQRGDQLITVIALDETVKKIKGRTPEHDQVHRQQQVQSYPAVQQAILGDSENHYKCLLEREPDVICLGYDQDSFDSGLQTFYTGQGQDLPTLVRLEAFEPQTYKSSFFVTQNT